MITWNPVFECGDPEIDEQHRGLVTTINRLDAAHAWGTGGHAMAFVLDELEKYAKTHFATEERFFEATGFPLAREHISEHRYFEERVAELRSNFEHGDQAAAANLLEMLGNWFVRHVANEDVKYRPFLPKRA